MNKDQVKGSFKEASGKAKEVTGKIIGNKALETKGIIEKNVGKAQVRYGEHKDDLKKGD